MNAKRSLDTGTDQLLCSVEDYVATVTLNRPEKRNALSDQLSPALRLLLPELEAASDVRCVVITGAGAAFCSGGDVSQMGGNKLSAGGDNLEARITDLQQRQRTLTGRLANLKLPTIAALPGPAAGAGMSIALACDLRIAAASAFITTGFGNIGLAGDYGGSWLLTRLVGPAIAKDLYFTGRRVGADEALNLGLVNRVVADDEFRNEVAQWAKRIAAGPPIAHRYMKEHIDSASTSSLDHCFDSEAEHLMRCAATDDHKEAVAAFMEKRAPQFSGR